MAIKQLSYGSHEDAELFNTDRPYRDGETRWAAKADWYIRFWGYLFAGISESDLPDAINVDGFLMFYDIDTDQFKVFDNNGDIKVLPFTPSGGIVEPAAVNSNITMSPDTCYIADSSGGNLQLTVPAAADNKGSLIYVKKTTEDNVVTLVTNTSETFDGDSLFWLHEKDEFVAIISDGTEWWVVGRYVREKVAVTITNADSPYVARMGEFILADPSGGAITINLPSVSGNYERTISVKLIDGTNDVTIEADGSELIDGSATLVLTTQYESVVLRSANGNWYIM